MTDTGIIVLLLILLNILFSYKGFTNRTFFDSYQFEIDPILVRKDYKRLVTSGFLHVSWLHLIFNMISLYAFCGLIGDHLGGLRFLIIYFSGLIGGGLLSLLIHRHHGDYSAVGASGAICGIIFAAIALFPGIGIGFFGLPFTIPGWLYGILYVLFSIYGIRSGKNNIGHDAHLGGGVVGMLTALVMKPDAFVHNYFTILLIAIPSIAFIWMMIRRPDLLVVDNFWFKTHHKNYSMDDRYNAEKNNAQRDIDRILDKIHKRGMSSLSRAELEKLKEHSKNIP
ncbi:rhomboid family intramembrane serine protease [Niabella pedocola]|uniref:Rhomboid family intramembrane serine protease n=1 Tax=Niabella pedocola TaxID=1752077 RepID=A0ABS8PKV2_9BACT|nr:rhomboid family intramembrane serine protease [Niabella pedocola]MCD2421737.1 rhomboid family intramembrane serine protease [Niabella pedocola]